MAEMEIIYLQNGEEIKKSIALEDEKIIREYDIEDYADTIVSAVIPDSVKIIYKHAFADSSLRSIVIPPSVEKIGDKAFCGCIFLKEIVISDGVKEIGNFCFVDCDDVKSIHIPKSVVSIGELAFRRSERSSFRNLTSDSDKFIIENGIFYEKLDDSSLKLVYVLDRSKEEYKILDNVSIIAVRAFEYCKNLKSIIIPETVTTINDLAFKACSLLESILISESVKTIGARVFSCCQSLKSINFPKYLETLGVISKSMKFPDESYSSTCGNFYACDSLLQVRIPQRFSKERLEFPENCNIEYY